MASSVVLRSEAADEILPIDGNHLKEGRHFLGEISEGEEEEEENEGKRRRRDEEEEEEDGDVWYLFGRILPKNEVIFICQVVILYVVIVTCIANLSLKNGDSNLWTALLSSSLGIMLPQPTISRNVKKRGF